MGRLLESGSPEAVYEWGVAQLTDSIDADVCKVAVQADGLLVPRISNNGGKTGREHAIPIATTIPGSVFVSGEGCTVPDLRDMRGGAATADSAGNAAIQPDVGHRSMVCAPMGDIGVIVGLAEEPEAFDEADLAFAQTIGRIMSGAADLLSDQPRLRGQGASHLLEEIACMISHDLRNKLNIVNGRLELAEETGETEHFRACADALDGVEAIADMVVTLARSGKPLDEVEAVDLRDATTTAFDPLNDPETQLTVKASATIMADPSCLSQLLENLFRNAIDHSSGPVRVEIGLLDNGFYVSDDGPGIPADIREEVFELGVSSSPDHDGKGLAIVRRLAEAHGWTVDVADSLLGGTRVEVRDVVFR